jgi:hypothetical protein
MPETKQMLDDGEDGPKMGMKVSLSGWEQQVRQLA